MSTASRFLISLGLAASAAAFASQSVNAGPITSPSGSFYFQGPPPVSLPYMEDFGDATSNGCGAAWAGEVCEKDWIATGAPGSVRLSSLIGSENVDVLMLTPGTETPNTVRRRVALDPEHEYLRLTMMAVAVGGKADLHTRVRFFNPNGLPLGTQTRTVELDDHSKTLTTMFPVPSDASFAVAIYGADNGTEGTEVALYSNDNHPPPCEECHYPEDWPPDGWDGDDCEEPSGDTCACDISCPEGTELFHECSEVGFCMWINHCECLDVDGECPLGDAEAYSF